MAAGYTGYTRNSASDIAQETVGIVSVDLTSNMASGRTRVGNDLPIDISVHVGQVQVTPAIGEQWIVTRVKGIWVLNTRLPGNKPSTPDLTQGQVQIGSSGPLELNGGLINVNAPLKLHSAETQYLPDASAVPSGSAMWDSAQNKMVISDGTHWRSPTGNIVLARLGASLGSTGELAETSYAKFARTVSFSGTGNLPTSAGYLPYYNSQGALAATAIPQFLVSPESMATGALSATRTIRYFTWNHGTGTLRAVIKAKVAGRLTGSGKLKVMFKLRATGHGALTATTVRQYVRTKNFVGSGTLRATSRQLVQISADRTGIGTLRATIKAKIVARLAGSGQLRRVSRFKPTGHGVFTATKYQKFEVSADFRGSGLMKRFDPFNEENVNRTNQQIPMGALGCYVTLIGAGGGGGYGNAQYGVTPTGAGGGGGGGRVDRVWILATSLGTTYTITRGTGGHSNGGNSVFSSGSITLTAGGGKKGWDASETPGGSPGGDGGTASAMGISANTHSGTKGGDGVTGSRPGVSDNTYNVGCGGGSGGAGYEYGGDGGDALTVSGGVGYPNLNGTTPSDAAAGDGGAGGGGGQAQGFPSTGSGGDGGLYGGGGGGAGSWQGGGMGYVGAPGRGGHGYTLVEWV